ncbi:restriction endonuclease subunit S [Cryobacterium sp. TMS1-20-1]|uniref:restriction endonuclease subunit S n=1 Tax=Cryobacterium sp. TMS1-20-1 TaxID=1259223 RepID=UPI00141BDBE9|nr:restriction endonuclease subunit S [Cryobacterium sp. TMS1-20-1]
MLDRTEMTFGDLGELFDGPHATPTRTTEGPYFLNISSLVDGRLDLDQSDHVSEVDFAKWTRRVTPKADDVLFSYETRLGDVALMPPNVEACLGRRMALLRPNRAVVEPGFLLYFYLSPVFQALIATHTIHGATVNRIGLSTMPEWPIAIPSLLEQRAIAEVLGALDDKIAVNGKQAGKAAELATATYVAVRSRRGERFLLDELVTTQYGFTTSAHSEPGPKFLRVTDINKHPWITWGSTPNCTLGDADREKYRVEEGDILVARMADPGKAAFIDEGDPEAVFASYLVRLKAKNPDDALFIYYFLRSDEYRNYSEGAMQGSVQMNMNAKVIVGTTISCPTRQDIALFNARIKPLRRVIQSALQENAQLAATRDALLPQLMSGKLRVKDVEKSLAGVL